MRGATQDHYEHELPLRPGDAARVSLTFRSIELGYEREVAGRTRDGAPMTDADLMASTNFTADAAAMADRELRAAGLIP